jgi:hypothetical protein
MKINVKKELTLGKAEEKEKVTVYTLLDEKFNKFVAVGNKGENLESMTKVLVDMDVTLGTKRVEKKNGEVEFINTSNTFINEVKKV